MEDLETGLNKGTLYYYNKNKIASYNFKKLNIKEDTKDYLNMNCIMTSKTNSGKSVFLKDMCYELKDRYQIVYVFSLTAHLQPDLFDFVPESNIINRWDEEFLNSIFLDQERVVMDMKGRGMDNKIPRVLIIYDDLISNPLVGKSEVLKKLFVMGRHAHISQIFLTQSFTACPPVLRKNCALAVGFYMDSIVDREAYAKQYLATDNTRQGIMILEKITKQPYNAICVLNCITSQNPEDTIRQYTARLKLPKFMMGQRLTTIKPKMYQVPKLNKNKLINLRIEDDEE